MHYRTGTPVGVGLISWSDLCVDFSATHFEDITSGNVKTAP